MFTLRLGCGPAVHGRGNIIPTHGKGHIFQDSAVSNPMRRGFST